MPPTIPDFLADAPAPQGTVLGDADAPSAGKRAASKRPPLDPVHQAIVDERKARVPGKAPQATRDALIELQYRNLGRIAPRVMARIEKALDDPTDPLHEMVVEKLMQRVIPTAFWESLGKREFASEETDKRPVFTHHDWGRDGAGASGEAGEQADRRRGQRDTVNDLVKFVTDFVDSLPQTSFNDVRAARSRLPGLDVGEELLNGNW